MGDNTDPDQFLGNRLAYLATIIPRGQQSILQLITITYLISVIIMLHFTRFKRKKLISYKKSDKFYKPIEILKLTKNIVSLC